MGRESKKSYAELPGMGGGAPRSDVILEPNNLVLFIIAWNMAMVEENRITHDQKIRTQPQGSHQVVARDLNGKIIKIVAPAHPKVSPGETLYLLFNKNEFTYLIVKPRKDSDKSKTPAIEKYDKIKLNS